MAEGQFAAASCGLQQHLAGARRPLLGCGGSSSSSDASTRGRPGGRRRSCSSAAVVVLAAAAIPGPALASAAADPVAASTLAPAVATASLAASRPSVPIGSGRLLLVRGSAFAPVMRDVSGAAAALAAAPWPADAAASTAAATLAGAGSCGARRGSSSSLPFSKAGCGPSPPRSKSSGSPGCGGAGCRRRPSDNATRAASNSIIPLLRLCPRSPGRWVCAGAIRSACIACGQGSLSSTAPAPICRVPLPVPGSSPTKKARFRSEALGGIGSPSRHPVIVLAWSDGTGRRRGGFSAARVPAGVPGRKGSKEPGFGRTQSLQLTPTRVSPSRRLRPGPGGP